MARVIIDLMSYCHLDLDLDLEPNFDRHRSGSAVTRTWMVSTTSGSEARTSSANQASCPSAALKVMDPRKVPEREGMAVI